ncbi:hypothetical protein P691DRAFT_723478 [Macrolepiota fuliginosa MF-IS2]|uniref:Uncharacterized protein n=1 Tax=Macrolepiota fuliginosa MF-IS2 TaxID=1400762 RepID=A0A9P5XJ82_9AGAR|nr:hypothetical protein P691DRAFT_723478 [Macrolepiota fuliginosa MF-IS2]
MPAAFSRLQLAAALLEYDNDPDNPDAPRRSAQESAIFAHFRRNPAAPPQSAARQSDYLGVSLPSETGSLGGKESAPGTRRSRGSIDALRNPFGADSNDEEEDAEEELEVDLTSWGLDAFMPKDKSRRGRGKAPSVAATAPPMTTVRSHHPSTNAEQVLLAPRRAVSYSRSMSLGGSLDFLREAAAAGPPDGRRRSIASPLDVAQMDPSRVTLSRPRSSSASLVQELAEPSQAIPFPTESTRAISPGPAESVSGRKRHERTFSMASMNSRMVLADVKEESRPQSTYGEEEEEEALAEEENPFTLQPPSHTSRFDPKYAAHPRTMSNASMGTRALLNDDRNSVMTGGGDNFHRERRYSTTLDLLRPKVLVMPSPLQSVAPPEPPKVDNRVRDGFTLSKDGPPLPPGARTSRRMSTLLSGSDTPPPIASNSFTPNPLNDLTYAQKLFRNTLAVDGNPDSYYEGLPRATEDGEQAQLYPVEPEVDESIPPPPVPETSAMKHLPGKLYGKSLIDDLETRKAQMRGKQRVFTGDERPSMMARGDIQRSSTLIDPATLGRPTSQFPNTSRSGEGLMRRSSGNIKPLLSFENDKIPQSAPMPNRPMDSRSVFGVDTLWQREMAKLREIEAQEKLENEARKKREEEEERRKTEKKGKKKRKDKRQGAEEPQKLPESPVVPHAEGAGPRVSIEPPVLPVIERAARRPPPPPMDDDEDEESDEEGDAVVSPREAPEPTWHSSDEEAPRRTTGVGLRYPNRSQSIRRPADGDSDEDLPLAATLTKVLSQGPLSRSQQYSSLDDDDDEEKPLSSLLEKGKVKQLSPALLDINFDKLSVKGPHATSAGDDEDDDQPLGLRASRIPPRFNNGGGDEDEDDRPLGLHPEQRRRTQYGMLAQQQQQQQQQQQMMMQAQLHNTMFFNPSMMGSGFFAPPVPTPIMNPMNPMMMMQPPMPIPSPPPIHDAAKFGRVDKWRRDVAVEGER